MVTPEECEGIGGCREHIFITIRDTARNLLKWMGALAGFLMLLIVATNWRVGDCADEKTVAENIKESTEFRGEIRGYMSEIRASNRRVEKCIEKTEVLDKEQDDCLHDLDKRTSRLENKINGR